MSNTNPTPGCWVDGSRGRHVVDRVCEIAAQWGWVNMHECDFSCAAVAEPSLPSDCEWADETEDEATSWMNDFAQVDGHSWGRNESGDWGLWADGCMGCGRDEPLQTVDLDPGDAEVGPQPEIVSLCERCVAGLRGPHEEQS